MSFPDFVNNFFGMHIGLWFPHAPPFVFVYVYKWSIYPDSRYFLPISNGAREWRYRALRLCLRRPVRLFRYAVASARLAIFQHSDFAADVVSVVVSVYPCFAVGPILGVFLELGEIAYFLY